MSYWENNKDLPYSDVVIDWLCTDHREIDIDAITRRYSDSPHAVLEVGIFSWVSRRVNSAIHGCYIATTESWRDKRKSKDLDKNRKPVSELPQVIKLTFMAVLPLTVDKTNNNCVLLGYHWDTGGWLGMLHLLDTTAGDVYSLQWTWWHWVVLTLKLPVIPFRGNVLKFDFELGVKAKLLPSGSKRNNTVSTQQNKTI